MSGKQPRSIADDPAVSRFVTVAENYCELLEHGTKNRKKLLHACLAILPELFLLAMRLPRGRECKRITNEFWYLQKLEGFYERFPMFPGQVIRTPKIIQYKHTRVPVARFHALSRRLSDIFRECNRYREVFDPYSKDEPIETGLANDLAEIWHNIRPNLLLFRMNDEAAKRHAVFEWSSDVIIHWGQSHFADAVKVIFYALEKVDDYWTLYSRRK